MHRQSEGLNGLNARGFVPKGGAKVGIKKTSLEFRDSFGNDGNISVLSVLNR